METSYQEYRGVLMEASLLAWGVLLVVLVLIASGRFRMELAALGGLLLLGALGFAPADIIFSGFGHPALATIIAVFMLSQGIIETGLLRGLGQALARRFQSIRGQIISIAGTAALLSSLMNNVGAVGLLLPTVVRMSGRSGRSAGTFGLPLAMAAILGGTLTLIGSAPNIIIASYMFAETEKPFKMFDFAPHGLAMLGVALVLWLICQRCGTEPGAAGKKSPAGEPAPAENADNVGLYSSTDEHITFAPLAGRDRKITLAVLLLAVLSVSFGLLHPAFGFGGAAFLFLLFGVLKLHRAYASVDLKIVFFLGAMLGLGRTLEEVGSLELLSALLNRFADGFSPFWLIVLLIFVSSALSNAINNAAAAVFMAPLALGLAGGSNLEPAAALMGVAAGSNMTLLLPTHQAALMVMSKAPFSSTSFSRTGLVLSLCCGLAAAVVVTFVWQ